MITSVAFCNCNPKPGAFFSRLTINLRTSFEWGKWIFYSFGDIGSCLLNSWMLWDIVENHINIGFWTLVTALYNKISNSGCKGNFTFIPCLKSLWFLRNRLYTCLCKSYIIDLCFISSTMNSVRENVKIYLVNQPLINFKGSNGIR